MIEETLERVGRDSGYLKKKRDLAVGVCGGRKWTPVRFPEPGGPKRHPVQPREELAFS